MATRTKQKRQRVVEAAKNIALDVLELTKQTKGRSKPVKDCIDEISNKLRAGQQELDALAEDQSNG